MSPSAPPWPVLPAPAHWRKVDFIADLHLQAAEPATFGLWQDYMRRTHADAVFILGDLFEVWVGDDVADCIAGESGLESNFAARCAQVLHAAAQRLDIFFMHGNRDFLLGPAFAKRCGMTLLSDPTALELAGQYWLLSHGDALCLSDADYVLFRNQVRSPAWQQDFLRQPLARRQQLARAMRVQSEQHKQSAVLCADLDEQASRSWLRTARAGTLIHGHTHSPAEHDLHDDLRRIVLSDWNAAATPPRAEVLRLHQSAAGDGAAGTLERLAAALA